MGLLAPWPTHPDIFLFSWNIFCNSFVCSIDCSCPSSMESCTLPANRISWHKFYVRASLSDKLTSQSFFFFAMIRGSSILPISIGDIFFSRRSPLALNATTLRLKVYRNWVPGHYFHIWEYWEIEQAIKIPFWRFFVWVMVPGWLATAWHLGGLLELNLQPLFSAKRVVTASFGD
jgi:hypothetical protein